MYLLRYMSKEELRLYLSGQEIVGINEHANQNICFFRENILTNEGVIPHEIMAESLSGIVSNEVLAKFYIDDKDFYRLEKEGQIFSVKERYANPFGGGWMNYIYPYEERIKQYDSNLFKLDSISINPGFSEPKLVSAKDLNLDNLEEYEKYSQEIEGINFRNYFSIVLPNIGCIEFKPDNMCLTLNESANPPFKLFEKYPELTTLFGEAKYSLKPQFYPNEATLPEKYMIIGNSPNATFEEGDIEIKNYENFMNFYNVSCFFDKIKDAVDKIYDFNNLEQPEKLKSFLSAVEWNTYYAEDFKLQDLSTKEIIDLNKVIKIYTESDEIENCCNFGGISIWINNNDPTNYSHSLGVSLFIDKNLEENNNIKILLEDGRIFSGDNLAVPESDLFYVPSSKEELDILNNVFKITMEDSIISDFTERLEKAGIDMSDFTVSLKKETNEKYPKIVMTSPNIEFKFPGNDLDNENIEIIKDNLKIAIVDPNFYPYLSFEDTIEHLTSYDYENNFDIYNFYKNISINLWNLNEEKAKEYCLEEEKNIEIE